jgi:hypothetical protein
MILIAGVIVLWLGYMAYLLVLNFKRLQEVNPHGVGPGFLWNYMRRRLSPEVLRLMDTFYIRLMLSLLALTASIFAIFFMLATHR